YFVGILAGHATQHTVGRSHGIATAFNSQLHNVLRVEIDWVWRERSTSSVLNTLVNRQDRNVTGTGQATMVVDGRKVAQYLGAAVAIFPYTVNKIRTRQVQQIFANGFAFVLQK